MTRYVYEPALGMAPGYLIKAVADDGRLLGVVEPAEIIAALRAADTGGPEAAEEWSEWLEHNGGPCPLPPKTRVECETGDGWRTLPGDDTCAKRWDWALDGGVPHAITRYRYRCLPGGWVARPKGWVPPASLWAEGSPVRCILRTDNTECDLKAPPAHWDGFTHIRLLPRAPASEPAPEMPEGFTMDARGNLFMATAKGGKILVLALGNVDFAGNATILAAVTAWCDAMKARP